MRPAPNQTYPRAGQRIVDVFHHVVCRHQVEVEVWPARIELNFADERWVNPITTQMRFEATVYNSDRGANWSVLDLAGNPGKGSIDAGGHYRAPPKGALPSGYTDVVVATAKENPLRKAFAWVTLVGLGPAPLPEPRIEILPKVVHLYYLQGHHNAYVDDSNKRQMFRADIRNSAATAVEWRVDNVLQAGHSGPWFPYKVPNSGNIKTVTVEARIKTQQAIRDQAKVRQLNYIWPGL